MPLVVSIFALLLSMVFQESSGIKGGRIVTKNAQISFPHQVQMAIEEPDYPTVFCGGTLISEKLLTKKFYFLRQSFKCFIIAFHQTRSRRIRFLVFLGDYFSITHVQYNQKGCIKKELFLKNKLENIFKKCASMSCISSFKKVYPPDAPLFLKKVSPKAPRCYKKSCQ